MRHVIEPASPVRLTRPPVSLISHDDTALCRRECDTTTQRQPLRGSETCSAELVSASSAYSFLLLRPRCLSIGGWTVLVRPGRNPCSLQTQVIFIRRTPGRMVGSHKFYRFDLIWVTFIPICSRQLRTANPFPHTEPSQYLPLEVHHVS